MNGFWFGGTFTPVSYQNQTSLVSSGDYLSYINKNNDIEILCSKVYRFHGWKSAEPSSSPVCQTMDSGDYQTLQQTVDIPRLRETDTTHESYSDLNADGDRERILTHQLSSGDGCGCDKQFLSLSDHQDMSPSLRKLKQQLARLTDHRCDRIKSWSVIAIDSKHYVLQGYKRGRPYDKRDSDLEYQMIPDRVLYEYRDESFVPVCRQVPDITTLIDRDVIEHQELNYLPLNN